MGSSSFDINDWNKYKESNISSKSATEIYTSTNLQDRYNPKLVKLRESRDSVVNANSRAIMIGLDVTGSMSNLLEIVAEKIGNTIANLFDTRVCGDPHIMCAAIGDSWGHTGDNYDKAPLQVTQFETDVRVAEQLTDLYFEMGGKGNGFESYPLLWYFAAKRTSIDCFEKRGKKGFLFTIGDDNFPNVLHKEEIERVFGDIVEDDIQVSELLAEVNRKYNVYHLHMVKSRSGYINEDKFKRLLGENIINVSSPDTIPDIINSIIDLNCGVTIDKSVEKLDSRTRALVIKDLSNMTSLSTNSNDSTELIDF